jgi:hypothetical protein
MADKKFFKSTIMPTVTVRVQMPNGAAMPAPPQKSQTLPVTTNGDPNLSAPSKKTS